MSTYLDVSWQASPDDHGSTVTAYIVSFRESDDLNFSVIADHCDPDSNSASFISKQCFIPMSIFREEPYSYEIDELIVLRVQAINSKGASDPSDVNEEGATA